MLGGATGANLTLAVAESLTCGCLQARIGAISGASGFFLGGITAYTLEQKIRRLGVPRELAAPVDCVSGPVAIAMAQGALRLFGSDIALATTGYAEPSPAQNIARPFAWIALVTTGAATDASTSTATGANANKTLARRIDCPAALPRTAVQQHIAGAACDILLGFLQSLAARSRQSHQSH
jgi:nicotinamide-nucleotide amidase